jgi:hypothetical protein
MASLLVRPAGGGLMTERDNPVSKISWNWDRVLLALALVVAKLKRTPPPRPL